MSELSTSVELVMRAPVLREPNTIPPMTDPMGRHWDQPDVSVFLIDDTHAVMTQRDFDSLHNYSHTLPTGCYPGKAWRCLCEDGWWLVWYDYSEKGPGWCSNQWRKIIIA